MRPRVRPRLQSSSYCISVTDYVGARTTTYEFRTRLLSLRAFGLVAALGADTFAAEDIFVWYIEIERIRVLKSDKQWKCGSAVRSWT